MAEFNTFIKLHRSILESAVFTDAEVLRLWIYILCKAAIEDREIIFDGKVVHLKKGQLITGRKKLAEHIGTSESKVYRSLKLLQDLKCINIEVNSKFSLVTVENWGKFQDAPKKVNSRTTANQQQNDSTPTADEQQNNTKEELNNYNNKKKYLLLLPTAEKAFSLFFEKWEREPNNFEQEAICQLLIESGEDFGLYVKALTIAAEADKKTVGYLRGIYANLTKPKSEPREKEENPKEQSFDLQAANRLKALNERGKKKG